MSINLPHCPLTHFNPTNFSEAPTGLWALPAAEQELERSNVVPYNVPRHWPG